MPLFIQIDEGGGHFFVLLFYCPKSDEAFSHCSKPPKVMGGDFFGFYLIDFAIKMGNEAPSKEMKEA